MSANQQQLFLQRVDVVDHRRVWSAGRNQTICQHYLDVATTGTYFIVCKTHFIWHMPQ